MNAPCFAPSQLRLLRLLSRGAADVPSIATALDLHASTVRDVLRRLRDRGLVTCGNRHCYSVTDQGHEAIAAGSVTLVDRSRLHLRLSKQQEAERARLMARTLDHARTRGLDDAGTEYLLRLAFPDGMTEAEIARYLGISRSAVNQSLLRALNKLKKARNLRDFARD